MSFIDSPRFPDEVAFYARGGRGFKTTVVETYGGDEFRNAAWTQQRGEWEIADALRSMRPGSNFLISTLLQFFRAVRGQLYAFRFKDFTDYQATDGGGIGGIFVLLTATTFQMYKRYSLGGLIFDQIIQKPVSATVVVTGGASPVVDYTTGIVTVASGTPTSWTGQFDIPCRFATDVPGIVPESGSAALYDWQALKLIEVRDIT